MTNAMDDMYKRIRCLSDSPPFLTAYLRYMTVFKGLAEDTAVSNFLIIRDFCQYIHYRHKFHEKPPGPEAYKQGIADMQLQELCEVTKDTALAYIDFLEGTVGNRLQTIKRKVSILRTFYSYLIPLQSELNISIPLNPFLNTRILVTPKTAVILSDSEIQRLLTSIQGSNDLRDRAIIMLILSSGLRLEELANLNEEDLQGNMLYITGESSRKIELNDDCVTVLNTYIQNYRSPIEDMLKDKALFISHCRRKRLSHRRIQQSIERRMAAAGLTEKGYSASTLRDTAIQKLLDACESHEVPAAMAYLGFRKSESYRRFRIKTSVAPKMRDIAIPGGVEHHG